MGNQTQEEKAKAKAEAEAKKKAEAKAKAEAEKAQGGQDPEVEVKPQGKYFVKEHDKETVKVVDTNGNTVRIYTEAKNAVKFKSPAERAGVSFVDDPKKSAQTFVDTH